MWRCAIFFFFLSIYLPSSPFFAFFASILSWNSTKILTCTSASSESSCFSCKCFFRQLCQYHLSRACCIPYLVDDNILHLPIFATLLLDLIVELLINLIRSDLGQIDEGCTEKLRLRREKFMMNNLPCSWGAGRHYLLSHAPHRELPSASTTKRCDNFEVVATLCKNINS